MGLSCVCEWWQSAKRLARSTPITLCATRFALCAFGLYQGHKEPDDDHGHKWRDVDPTHIGQHATNRFQNWVGDGVDKSYERVVGVGVHPGDDRTGDDDVTIYFEEA